MRCEYIMIIEALWVRDVTN